MVFNLKFINNTTTTTKIYKYICSVQQFNSTPKSCL